MVKNRRDKKIKRNLSDYKDLPDVVRLHRSGRVNHYSPKWLLFLSLQSVFYLEKKRGSVNKLSYYFPFIQ